MKKLRLTVELTYDDESMYGDDEESKNWFLNDILGDAGELILHSNDIGDSIGELKVLSVEEL